MREVHALDVNRSGGAVDGGWNEVASSGSAPPRAAKPASQPNTSIYTGKTEESGKPGAADQGLKLNLRNVSVDQAIDFLAESEGLNVYRAAGTAFSGSVDVVSDTPLNKDETVGLLNKVLSDHNLTAVRDGNALTVMTLDEALASAQTPVSKFWAGGGSPPADEEMVTEIIPVHSLNPAQVSSELNSLLPPGTK